MILKAQGFTTKYVTDICMVFPPSRDYSETPVPAQKVKHGVMYDSKEREGTKRRHQVDTVVEGM